MSQNIPSNSNLALADCALWAFRELITTLAQPDVSSSVLIDQIILTARALRTLRDAASDAISADFLRGALNAPAANATLPVSAEELLCGATTLIANRETEEPANEWVSNRIYGWVAEAWSRRTIAA